MADIPRVLYGEASFRAFYRDNGYYVDKTQFMPLLEKFRSPVYLRPRRFGKSLLCTTLQFYYHINQKEHFPDYFGKTWIGANPTAEQGSYFVLHFDFSVVACRRLGLYSATFLQPRQLDTSSLCQNQ